MNYGTDYCKIIIVGAVASDITLNRTHEGVPVANFDILHRSMRNECHYPVAVFGFLGEETVKTLHKGERVLLEGHLFADEVGAVSIRAVRVFPA